MLTEAYNLESGSRRENLLETQEDSSPSLPAPPVTSWNTPFSFKFWFCQRSLNRLLMSLNLYLLWPEFAVCCYEKTLSKTKLGEGSQRQELKQSPVRTTAHHVASSGLLSSLSSEMAHPTVGWTLLHQIEILKMPHKHAQSDGQSSLVMIPSFQVCLHLIHVDKTNTKP